MPFCASRGVNELRCVFRMSKDEEMVHVSDEVVAKFQAYVTTNEESDYDLFCATMFLCGWTLGIIPRPSVSRTVMTLICLALIETTRQIRENTSLSGKQVPL